MRVGLNSDILRKNCLLIAIHNHSVLSSDGVLSAVSSLRVIDSLASTTGFLGVTTYGLLALVASPVGPDSFTGSLL